MVITLHFVDITIFVSAKFHGSPEDGNLLVAAHELHFAISGEEEDRRGIRTAVENGCHIVDQRFRSIKALLLAVNDVTKRISADGSGCQE